MRIETHGPTIHLRLDGTLYVFDKAVFLDALKRGKAVRRAQAQRAREAIMAEAAERKRADRSLT